jgi:acetyl esterase/lipase
VAIKDRLDPELAPIVAQFPVFDLADLPKAREDYLAAMAMMSAASDPDVAVRDIATQSRAEHPPVRLREFRPKQAKAGALPAILWIQGGGYVMPSPDLDDVWCQDLALAHHCAVYSVDWRRAPEHPFPAASEDCYTGLSHIVAHAVDLGLDQARIVIAGASSGGGSAASLALMVRDRAEFSIAHQMLIYPMLDDRNDTPSAHEVTDANVWNRTRNAIAWKAYLGESYGTDHVSPYAAPSRMKDLSGSIPASILTGELDLFRDENILFATRLIAAEVSTELHVYPGAPHGFERIAPAAAISQQFFADRDAILRRVFGTKN